MKDGKTNLTNSISTILGIDPEVGDRSLAQLKETALKSETDDIEKQRKYVKDTMVEMIVKGKGALDELSIVARESEKSRDYEVIFNGIKVITEIAEKLLDAEIVGRLPNQPEHPSHIDNRKQTIYVGTLSDLNKLRTEQRKQFEQEQEDDGEEEDTKD